MILDNIKSITYDKNKTHSMGIKSAIIWGNIKDTNEFLPLLYISKPKNISQEDYELLLDRLIIDISKHPLEGK